MFLTPDLPMLLKGVTLKFGEDGHREAHCKFIIEPFNVNLARELGEAIAAHLFGDDDTPKREVKEVGFHLVYGLQRMTARSHPELPAVATLEDVRIEGIKVTRPDPDKPRLKLEFVGVVPIILERQVIEFIVSAFGTALYVTFQAQQLSFTDRDEATAPTRNGSMTLSVVHADGSTEQLAHFENDAALQQAATKARGTH